MDSTPSFRALHVLEWLLTPSWPVVLLGLAVVLLVPIALHLYLTREAAYVTPPSILLVGPSGAGKTALVAYLERVALSFSADGHSSFRDDLDAAGAVAQTCLLVDTPGHGKLRGPTLQRLATTGLTKKDPTGLVRAVVFVVDAAVLAEPDSLGAAAAYLYDVLLALQRRMAVGTNSSRPPPALPVLIAANKTDLFTALPATAVRVQLEAELGRIRASRSRGRQLAGEADENAAADDDAEDVWLGTYGSKTFSFAQMRTFDTEVDVVPGSLAGTGAGVDGWWKWMEDKMVQH